MSVLLADMPLALAARRGGPARSVGNLWRLALADVLERTRRPAYLVSLLVMAWIANAMLPPAGAGYRTFDMSGRFRPAYGPEWVGTLVGVMSGLYFLFVGFYLVKGAIERDRRTGVGQILAAARVSRRRYLAGKALSNFVVLASMLVVALGVALVTQQLLGEDRRFDPLATALPLFAIALPTAAVVAASAVLVECIPGLAGGGGNVAWFFVAIALLSSGALSPANRPSGDLIGVGLVSRSTYATLHALRPEVRLGTREISIGVNVSEEWRRTAVQTFRWPGLRMDAPFVLSRLAGFAWAVLLVALAALVFDRFERAARVRGGGGGRLTALAARLRPARAEVVTHAPRLQDLAPATRGSGFGSLVRAELTLLLHGRAALWGLGALGLMIAMLVSPARLTCAVWLPVASIWPVLLWSALGSRERLHGTEGMLFAVARPVTRPLAAAWLAGALVMLGIGATGVLRLALAGQGGAVAGWLLGCALLPACALALGVWSGNGKLFEVLLLTAWYVGPMHHLPELDYTGVTAQRAPMGWVVYAALVPALLAAAWAGRARQVRR